jgi:hypothetical protein
VKAAAQTASLRRPKPRRRPQEEAAAEEEAATAAAAEEKEEEGSSQKSPDPARSALGNRTQRRQRQLDGKRVGQQLLI